MILFAAMLAAALSVVATGGRLSLLGRVHLRAKWTVVAALALQVLIISVFPGQVDGWRGQALAMASYALGGVFLVANRRVPFLWLAGLGALCNLAAIGANGGVMPASTAALRAAGRWARKGNFINSRHLVHAKLAFLGDIFAIPRRWPLANVFSIGDVLLVVGAAALLHTVCASRATTAIARLSRSLPRPASARPRSAGSRSASRPDRGPLTRAMAGTESVTLPEGATEPGE
jgi:Family of unknown function (DUF5317)